MPSIMAANIGVWTNPHPLGQTTKEPIRSSGWMMDKDDSSQSGHGELDAFQTTTTTCSSHPGSTRFLDPSAARPRRPLTRNDNQKLIEVRNRIFVGGLTEAINEDDLRLLFGRYGTVVEVAIKARGGEQFRGFGFVTFNRNSEAAAALRDCAGEIHSLHGKKINVCAAFKRVDKVPTSLPGPPPMQSPIGQPGWIGPAPTPMPAAAGPLPMVFNPYYLGPPVISNGMWYVGPASCPGAGINPAPPFPGFSYGQIGGGMAPGLGGMGNNFFPCTADGPGAFPNGAMYNSDFGPLCRPGISSSCGKRNVDSRKGMDFGAMKSAMTSTEPREDDAFASGNSKPLPWFAI